MPEDWSLVQKMYHYRYISLKTPTNCHHDNSTTVKGAIIRKVRKWLSNYILSSSEFVGKIMKTCHLENILNVKGHIWNSPLTYNFAYSGKVKLKNERYSSWNAATLLCFTEEIRKLHPRFTRLAVSTLTITPSMWFRSTCGIAWTSMQPIDVCMSTSKRHYGHMFIFYMRIRFDAYWSSN